MSSEAQSHAFRRRGSPAAAIRATKPRSTYATARTTKAKRGAPRAKKRALARRSHPIRARLRLAAGNGLSRMVRSRLALLLGLLALPAAAQENVVFRTPPEEIRKLVEAPPPPSVLVDPAETRLVLLDQPGCESLAEIAEPELRLAGLRINPRNHNRVRVNVATGSPSRRSPRERARGWKGSPPRRASRGTASRRTGRTSRSSSATPTGSRSGSPTSPGRGPLA